MKDIKSFESRIRGWFPHEPFLISTHRSVINEKSEKAVVIPANYNVSTMKASLVSAVLYLTVYTCLIYLTLYVQRYPISAFQVAAWIIVGSIAGLISSVILTKNQLYRLSKRYLIFLNSKDVILLVVPMVLFLVGGCVYVNFWMSNSSFQELLISFYGYAISVFTARAILFAAFEKNTGMRIMQRWFDSGYVLIPKAPRNIPADGRSLT